MKDKKENANQPGKHDVETPAPPQVMDPSKSPHESSSNKAKKDEKNRSSKSTKNVKDRTLSPNEEL